MKFKLTAILTLSLCSLEAQTVNDPMMSDGDPSALLELPPVIVIDEDSEEDTPVDDEAISGDAPEDGKKGTAEPAQAVHIQVEKIAGQTVSKRSDGKVRIEAPWPAKPISVPPTGWKFAPAPEGTEPFRTEVKLTNGKMVELAITPYVLVPLSDTRNSIKITEPGYEAALQYEQKDTLGVMLQNSTAEIERHEKHAANAIQRLQELLTSLPREQK